jgi:hypothetical protein
MKTVRLMPALAAMAVLLTAAPAHAGRNCEARPATAINVQRALELAQRTAQALDASGAEVAVLARSGQDLGRYGLRWSHLGWAYREGKQWRVVHKLNQCGSAHAELYRQGLAEFFMDDLFEYRAAFAVPSAEFQAPMHALLQDNGRVASLHMPAYNMVAYPWSQQYQQSNQWAIETMALAHENTAMTRQRAQAWLRFKGYEPTTLRIGAVGRLGARMTAGNVAFDDHPNHKRFGDRIETVTVDSVFDWLERARLANPVQVVR